jgi:PhnB protein
MNSIQTRSVETYLSFPGNCEEAIRFYEKALGAKLEFMMRYKETPQPQPAAPPGFEEKICHCSLRIGPTKLMAADMYGKEPGKFQGFSLAIAVPTEAEVDEIFKALSDGGVVKMPPAKTFWALRFGVVEDRFGVNWLVTTET